ncbi:PspC domain-containing protein [Emticicia sp. CRIBPO]|uniref:PspC domain-containing protein n=1 Tax=Emticicia sp. CRIBPO TaxID=2683258 RepID=UPI001412EB69|nr:PspC domain-containing protein [Emticicia sp. CRIBPO]NBA85086.1 PspC domain-containing protein [Emticicia sp. CRIBPO]
MEKKLTRVVGSDKMFFGVCGGLAKYFSLDPTLIRILVVIATILGVGSPILVYILMVFVMPKEEV